MENSFFYSLNTNKLQKIDLKAKDLFFLVSDVIFSAVLNEKSRIDGKHASSEY